ncbi:LacI family DNA-binding transcriptional regulator [Lactiplantibacillus dongliensis]|uniref:LacI family DNA-binding transcriptional regulator n=1 Tax=Lactiplantibacillus dongliensis TaxID=2559919 RepID=A0ABW1R775_9LACO|nr:LacI family DNA-binding transcriptional regulator [Lactiplantibacillus dongliensis]
MKAVTIKDVAKQAGVSIGTVSRVFNGYPDISESTRKRIFKIAKDVGYSPNLAARTLSSKRQKTIALIFNDLVYTPKTTMPMSILNGVYDYTQSKGIEFAFYAVTTQKQKQKSFEQFCSERNVSGVILQGLHVTDPYYEQLKTTKIPTVLIDMYVDNPYVGSVSTDNVAAAKDAVSSLIKSGRKNIDMMNGSYNATVSVWREQGYHEALEAAELPPNSSLIQYANYDEQIARLMAKQVIEQDSTIDAFFCASDLMALGVIKAAQELNKRIPEDIAVMGFDGIELGEYVTPSLSTVSQQPYQFGQEAGKLVMELIDKPTLDHVLIRHVPYKVITRESSD